MTCKAVGGVDWEARLSDSNSLSTFWCFAESGYTTWRHTAGLEGQRSLQGGISQHFLQEAMTTHHDGGQRKNGKTEKNETKVTKSI